jgi:Spy/CpxP family protein refolding chaperone
MKGWLLTVGLLLSIGFNLGLLVSVLGDRGPAITVGAEGAAPFDPSAPGPDPPEMTERSPQLPTADGSSGQNEARAADDSRRLADRLGLRGGRRERFLAVHADLRQTIRTRGPRLVVLRRQVSRELVFDRPDRQRIERLIQQMAEHQAELDRAMARAVLESRELLEPRQEALFRRFLTRRLREWRPVAERSPTPPPG